AQPDVVIGIDSPDFCLRVDKIVKARSQTRVVHYVAPSVWAWRPGRAQKMVGVVDQVLALLPFEPPYLEKVGIHCDFVGHPVAAEPVATADEIATLRQETGLGDASVLVVLPGSRGSEVARMAPIYGSALGEICAARPDLRVLVPTIGPRLTQLREAIKNWPGNPVLLAPESGNAKTDMARKRAGFSLGSAALATSGTVSLELAAADTPMVIAYDTNWLTREIIRRMLRIDTLTLVNLVSETRAVPEFLAENCRADLIAPAVLKLLDAPKAQRDALELTMRRLGRGGDAPGLRAARAILERLPGKIPDQQD
ncbi:MAG: lipid-A-disaccharide synthase, partial [Pseudomonadota bacterium]